MNKQDKRGTIDINNSDVNEVDVTSLDILAFIKVASEALEKYMDCNHYSIVKAMHIFDKYNFWEYLYNNSYFILLVGVEYALVHLELQVLGNKADDQKTVDSVTKKYSRYGGVDLFHILNAISIQDNLAGIQMILLNSESYVRKDLLDLIKKYLKIKLGTGKEINYTEMWLNGLKMLYNMFEPIINKLDANNKN